ncbi:hypothetical protein V6N13_130487 [Hibiscus sabdariffa]
MSGPSPRVLEHMVDVVSYPEGKKCSSHRLLRLLKIRLVDEQEIFERAQLGLQTVLTPTEIFLRDPNSDLKCLAGSHVAIVMDRSWALLIEISALCVSRSIVSRHVNGIQTSRDHMIIFVIAKEVAMKIQKNVVFLNVVSGVSLMETVGNLTIASSIYNSFSWIIISNRVAFNGGIGLSGKLNMVPMMEKRVSTTVKLKYKMAMALSGDDVGFNVKNVDDRDLKCVFINSNSKNDPATEAANFTFQVIVLNYPGQTRNKNAQVINCHTSHIAVKFAKLLTKIDRRSGKEREKEPNFVKNGDTLIVKMNPTKPVVVETFSAYPPFSRFVVEKHFYMAFCETNFDMLQVGFVPDRLPAEETLRFR